MNEFVENCPHDPRELLGQPIGMYHCPLCGMMVIAGFPHPGKESIDILEYNEGIDNEH